MSNETNGGCLKTLFYCLLTGLAVNDYNRNSDNSVVVRGYQLTLQATKNFAEIVRRDEARIGEYFREHPAIPLKPK